ncbi:MAG: hypothetical protein JWR69_3264, partial [Pedosphaera sp.]|nr:hypothetical protein [Pedosphaera sp.]
MIPITRLAVATVWLCALNVSFADVSVVERPTLTGTNHFYVGNRQPLAPSQFIQLPAGSIEPRGWLKALLERQREGLTGHLGEISAWLQKDDNAWLSKDGKGKYGWEELPYWLKGYIDLAYIFNDPKMIKECNIWIEGALASQRPSGDFGPDQRFEDSTRDYWANMIMLFCLQSYYEHSQDPRVLDLMTRYFKYQLSVPDDQMLTGYWQKMRGGDNLYSIYWLYNLTGDPQLLELAKKIHLCTANWKLNNDLPNWHNVNIAQCFREPAEYFLQTHDRADLQAAYANFREVRKRYGQVPGGMFGGDENCRPGFSDPHQAVETCGMVEQMLSDEMLMRISGDSFWGDQCEEVAFNSYPAAVMADFKALRYLTAPNMVVSDGRNHSPGLENGGPFLMMNPFSSRCCQHNHSHGWPYFNKNLWMATPDDGVCAALYSASEVRVRVGDGTQVRITEETHYPFEERIQFTLAADKSVTFPLYLRIPAWCKAARVMINNKPVKVVATPGEYVRVEREWKNRDVVTLDLPMDISVRRWDHNHDSVSVDYGPLTFALKIGERYDRHDSTKTAIGDSSWQTGADQSKWPSFEIHPTSPWNYGLVLDEPPAKAFKIKKGEWPKDDFPFTTESAPIWLEAKAKRIPEWTLDRHELCATLQASPVLADGPVETVSLIPMGSARLRISAFPVVGSGPTAHRWIAPEAPKQPLYKTSASHVFDDLSAPCDEVVPVSSNDQSISRFTWWNHRGTAEWFQYDFEKAKQISEVSVYWFDDTGAGQCRVPQSWRLLYQEGGEWKPVIANANFGTKPDDWNRVQITPVNTTSLRLEVQLQPNFSGGILEWR